MAKLSKDVKALINANAPKALEFLIQVAEGKVPDATPEERLAAVQILLKHGYPKD